ncbi:MAG: hypothetical protein ABR881_19555 [Candidatus Sulfotelmatobacter sp.]|jgi:hypothetical protein
MSSDAPRSVRIARRLVGAIALVPLSSLLIWTYTHEIKPYEVRYYAQPASNNPAKFEVSIYSAVDAADSALVSLDCHPDNLVDVTFRPVLQESRDWSLREMFPSVSEVSTFLTGRNAPFVDEVADRHLPGGLSEWEGLERIQLQNQLDLALANSKSKLTSSERTQLEQQFISLAKPHQTNLLLVPARMSRADQVALRNAIDRAQQVWETSIAIINSNWLLRWQALTGTALAVPIKGVGAATPLYLSIPPLKQGAGVVLGIERESPIVPQTVQVVVGDTAAYRVRSLDRLKSSSVLLLIEDDWWLVPALVAFVAICALVYYSYWRWPKHLKTPELFREAQKRKSDELWGELRTRSGWLDSYVVSQFFAARTIMVPNADVISYFWRCVRDALSAHAVPATTDAEVRQAILEILDRSIQNALT